MQDSIGERADLGCGAPGGRGHVGRHRQQVEFRRRLSLAGHLDRLIQPLPPHFACHQLSVQEPGVQAEQEAGFGRARHWRRAGKLRDRVAQDRLGVLSSIVLDEAAGELGGGCSPLLPVLAQAQRLAQMLDGPRVIGQRFELVRARPARPPGLHPGSAPQAPGAGRPPWLSGRTSADAAARKISTAHRSPVAGALSRCMAMRAGAAFSLRSSRAARPCSVGSPPGGYGFVDAGAKYRVAEFERLARAQQACRRQFVLGGQHFAFAEVGQETDMAHLSLRAKQRDAARPPCRRRARAAAAGPGPARKPAPGPARPRHRPGSRPDAGSEHAPHPEAAA